MSEHDCFTIQPMDPDNYRCVRSLWTRCGLASRPNGRDSEQHIRKELAAKTGSFLVAVDADKSLIGTVFATHDGRKGWINRLAVDPRWRGRGVAQALVSTAEIELRKCGIEIIGCLIEDGNSASARLFDTLGYSRHDDIHYYTKRDRPDI